MPADPKCPACGGCPGCASCAPRERVIGAADPMATGWEGGDASLQGSPVQQHEEASDATPDPPHTPSRGVPAPPQEAQERWPDEWFPLISMMQRLGGGSANACRGLLAATLDDACLEVCAKGQGPAAGPSEPWVTPDNDGRRWRVEVVHAYPGGYEATLRPLSGSADTEPSARQNQSEMGSAPEEGE